VNPLLRFAVSSFCWIFVAGSQWMFNRLIYWRFVEDRSRHFLDLLLMSNISVFVLDEDLRCFFLHGESPDQSADVDLKQLLQNLETTLKGSPGYGGAQELTPQVVYISRGIRDEYDEHYTQILKDSWQKRAARPRAVEDGGSGRERNTFRESETYASETLLKATNHLQVFLKNIFGRNAAASDLNPVKQIKRSWLASRFNLPPPERADPEGADISYMCEDEYDHFTSVFLRGMEYDLVIVYALLHACCDLIWSSTALSLLIVYAADRVIQALRKLFGKRNLAAKTLVDFRFIA
jgi:meckelin